MKIDRIARQAFLVCILLLCACGAFAVEGESSILKSGVKEISFTASLSTSYVEDVDVDQAALLASFGYFLTEQHEVGINFGYNYLEADDVDCSTTILHVFYSYHIRTNQPSIVPYIGCQLGFGANEVLNADADVTSFGVYGGLKYFLTPSAEIFVQPSYMVQEWDADRGEDFDVKRVGIDLGIGILF